MQHKLPGRTRTEMHRSMADLMHDIRVPGTDGVFRGPLRDPLRQELEPTAAGPEESCLCGPAQRSYAYQPFTGQEPTFIL